VPDRKPLKLSKQLVDLVDELVADDPEPPRPESWRIQPLVHFFLALTDHAIESSYPSTL